MSLKAWAALGIFIGSTLGSYLPVLWGDSAFLSGSSIVGSLVGGLAGVWIGYRAFQYFS